MLTRREFLRKSAILAGGVAVAATVPSVALAGVKKEAPVDWSRRTVKNTFPNPSRVTTGHDHFEPRPYIRNTKNLEEFLEHFNVIWDSHSKEIGLTRLPGMRYVDIKATPYHIHQAIQKESDDVDFLFAGNPTMRITRHIVHFNDGWRWQDGQDLVFDSEYIIKWVLKDGYTCWRKPEDILFR